jgi:hypothetical protein
VFVDSGHDLIVNILIIDQSEPIDVFYVVHHKHDGRPLPLYASAVLRDQGRRLHLDLLRTEHRNGPQLHGNNLFNDDWRSEHVDKHYRQSIVRQ